MPEQPKDPSAEAPPAARPPISIFNRIGRATSRIAGRPVVTMSAVLLILGWIAVGPIFGFSDTWQLFMNTLTSIVTFLMVFLMQSTQTRDTEALQLKLDELIRAVEGAENKMISLDDADEEELKAVREKYRGIAAGAADPAREVAPTGP